MVQDAEGVNLQRESPLPLLSLCPAQNERPAISYAYNLLKALSSPGCIAWSHTTGMTVGLSPIPAYQVRLSGVSYCGLTGLIPVWWQSPPGRSCRTFLLEYIALINFRHCLRCPRCFAGTLWTCIPMRFWPWTPENLEIKLPDEFRHCNVHIAGVIWKHNVISIMGRGLCLSIIRNGRKGNTYWFHKCILFFTVPKEMEEIRDSICDYHMEYSARKIYQPANLQFLVLNLTYELCFSSYKWKSLNI